MYNDNQMDIISDVNVFRTVIVNGSSDGYKDKAIQCNDECIRSISFQESELIRKHMNRGKSNDSSRDNMYNLFSEHTRLTGRSRLDQGTILNVDQNYSFQVEARLSTLDPKANYSGDGLNYVQTDLSDNTHMWYNDCIFEHVEPGNHEMQCESNNIDTHCNIKYQSGKHFMVHFTNWQYVQHDTGMVIYIVYIDGLIDHINNTSFYYFVLDCENRATIFRCDNMPQGMLTIQHSDWCFIIQSRGNEGTYDIGTCLQTVVDPQVALENYQKDCVVQKFFHMSYERYMQCIIDAIIKRQDVSHDSLISGCERDNVHMDNSRYTSTVTNPTLTKNNNNPESEPFSPSMGEVLDYYTEHGVTGGDVYFPEKQLGHLTLQTHNFEFIGPDRQVTAIDNIDQYLHVATTIKATGKSNYMSARIPVKSDLNLEAWEEHLRDYPDKRLFQYLKFGFPLSLRESDQLSNTQVVNHYSALQYPEQVLQYLNKEREWGPFWALLTIPQLIISIVLPYYRDPKMDLIGASFLTCLTHRVSRSVTM